jgi:hypothetical protein
MLSEMPGPMKNCKNSVAPGEVPNLANAGRSYTIIAILKSEQEASRMIKEMQELGTIFCALVLCCVTLAQEPVVDIDAKRQSNLAAAQRLVVEANRYVLAAQKDNRWDMKGHAEKARQLLVEVNRELKAAAEAADAADAMQRK